MELIEDLTTNDTTLTYTPTRSVVAHYCEPPVRIDTAIDAGEDMVQVERAEVRMLREVARRLSGDDGDDSDDSDTRAATAAVAAMADDAPDFSFREF